MTMKLLQKALTAITVAAGIVFMLSMCALDGTSETPVIALFLSGFWLGGYIFTWEMMKEDRGGQCFWDR